MTNSLFSRFDALFRRHWAKSSIERDTDAHDIRVLELNYGTILRRGGTDEQAFFYEVVFLEGDHVTLRPDNAPSPGNIEILEAVLRENRA